MAASKTHRIVIFAIITTLGCLACGPIPPSPRSKSRTIVDSANSTNPYSPSTTICYDLPKSDSVTIVLYNASGELVDTLISEFVELGHHCFVPDVATKPVGIYFYKLTSGTFTETKKMVLLK